MDVIRKIYKQNGTLHHAYLIIGDAETALRSLKDFLEKELSVSTKGNPDFIEVVHDTFGIDEARHLKSSTSMRAIDLSKFAVISLNSITVEAQNSLLKIFEEPVGQTTFFVIAPSLEIFIPTLLSRFFIIELKKNADLSESEKKNALLAKKFLASSPAKRMSLVDDLIEKKDKIVVIDFLNSLESLLANEFHTKGPRKEIISACNEIIKYKGYLYDRSPSIKMLLHHISCTIGVLDGVIEIKGLK